MYIQIFSYTNNSWTISSYSLTYTYSTWSYIKKQVDIYIYISWTWQRPKYERKSQSLLKWNGMKEEEKIKQGKIILWHSLTMALLKRREGSSWWKFTSTFYLISSLNQVINEQNQFLEHFLSRGSILTQSPTPIFNITWLPSTIHVM